jgi:hypothetical protein
MLGTQKKKNNLVTNGKMSGKISRVRQREKFLDGVADD